ncbi:MAG: nuclear transport factor 2 family protein [Actinomycetota bacterium]
MPQTSDSARAECERLVHHYCAAYDRRDATAVLRLVTDDVQFELAGGELIDSLEQLAAHVQDATEEGTLTHHHVTTFAFEHTSETNATGDLYMLIPYLRSSAEPRRTGFLSRRYADRYRLVDGQWRIAHRRFVDQIIH